MSPPALTWSGTHLGESVVTPLSVLSANCPRNSWMERRIKVTSASSFSLQGWRESHGYSLQGWRESHGYSLQGWRESWLLPTGMEGESWLLPTGMEGVMVTPYRDGGRVMVTPYRDGGSHGYSLQGWRESHGYSLVPTGMEGESWLLPSPYRDGGRVMVTPYRDGGKVMLNTYLCTPKKMDSILWLPFSVIIFSTNTFRIDVALLKLSPQTAQATMAIVS